MLEAEVRLEVKDTKLVKSVWTLRFQSYVYIYFKLFCPTNDLKMYT